MSETIGITTLYYAAAATGFFGLGIGKWLLPKKSNKEILVTKEQCRANHDALMQLIEVKFNEGNRRMTSLETKIDDISTKVNIMYGAHK